MSFRTNQYQQLSLFDQLAFLSAKRFERLKNSWAQTFSDHIFSRIDESVFACLYSPNANSRPNAPINVLVGALILKEYTGLTDEELVDSCLLDYRYSYALHITSFDEPPISERSLSRFRSRCAAYELTTGEDLIHKCFVPLSEDIRKYMKISPNVKRMDSMMVESNIRKMGRLELLYTCLANLVSLISHDGNIGLIKGLEDYANPNNRNAVCYHDDDTPMSQKLQKVIDDAASLLPKCQEEYGETTDYQLLQRAINEQTKKDDNGKSVPKTKEDGMKADLLQNPSDPDATFRCKAGKEHRGYVANLTETVDENGSVITDYQYDVNTHSDIEFIKETIQQSEKTEETTTIITDGAYGSKEVNKLAEDKNIIVKTTGLRGHKVREILSRFEVSEDGLTILKCPKGYTPLHSSYNGKYNYIRASFNRSCCESCPHREECLAKLYVRTARVKISPDAIRKVELLKEHRTSEEWKKLARIRNGVETVPSVLRNKYNVDKMPVRGKIRTKHRFGLAVFALNFSKLYRYVKGLEKCRAFQPE